MSDIEGITPHGGELIDRLLHSDGREAARERARHLPQILLGPMSLADVEMLAVGAMSPLSGFMNRADYERVVSEMRLADGPAWSIPVTLPVSTEQAAGIREGQEVALVEGEGHILAVMTVQEKFGYDKRLEAREVYRTEDDKHPGVARLYKQGDVLLGGPVHLIDFPTNREFLEFRHTPTETRRMFARRGWKTIVAFQTRNPIHRSHEYIQKTALEIVDGLLLHPLVGETQASDIPADVRMASYQAILRDYYPPDRVLLGVFPAAMRYAGPREAIFHALCRKNYGCTHFIVGRDHAGVGKYYGTYDAQRIFDEFEPEEIGITPLMFENTFYCRKCGGIVSAKTCPHGEQDHVIFSGTEVRRRLETGEPIPPEFTRPEVYRVLVEGMRAKRGEVGEQADKVTRASGHAQADKVTGPVWGGRKVLVVGLDCAEPSLVFDRWREELPNLNRLMSGGVYGNLESCIPAITVPAWSVMMSSRDPGQLGIYGFRNRADYSYDKMTIATGSAVKVDRVWDILSRAGKQVITVGVPGSYPPRPVNGVMVGCFLTPNTTKSQYTYPPELKDQIASWVGEYQVDVPQFRTEDKDFLLKQIYDMTDQHFVVVKKLLTEKPWDFFMFVEMGVDRIHHGLWKYTDPAHPKFEPGNKWQDSIRDYYKKLDGYIGEVLSLAAQVAQDTAVLVVSDHGAKTMHGGIALNEWLIRNGWLVLKSDAPTMITPFEKVEVDWSKTRAWGSGGYYGRVFLNVAGREPHGTIPPVDYERVRDELARALESIPAPDGRNIGTVAFRPEKVYKQVQGIPPDLVVYFGNLDWRAVGSLGVGDIYTFENDTGPDDANHAQQGLYIVYDPAREGNGGQRLDAHIMDIAPTVLDLMGLPVPRDMNGNVIKLN